MDLIVDGIIYELQKRGGISRIFHETLPRLCSVEPDIRVTLLSQGVPGEDLPAHARIARRELLSFSGGNRFLRRGVRFLARRVLFPWIIKTTPGQIWHSTYYTLPQGRSLPVVLTVADLIHEWFPELLPGRDNGAFRLCKKRCIKCAEAVICISETTRRDLIRFHDVAPEKTYVVHLAAAETFRPKEDIERPQRPFLLYVGSRVHYKNFDLLLKAFSRWSKKEDYDLVAVGPPWSREENRKVRESGLDKTVKRLSYIDDEKLCELYNQAEAFVYPSLYEGFGIPLLEAMACGCPVVASRIPTTEEIAGSCPHYFDPRDAEALRRALDDVWSQGRTGQRIKDGLKRVEMFSWEKTARKTLDVYKSVLTERST